MWRHVALIHREVNGDWLRVVITVQIEWTTERSVSAATQSHRASQGIYEARVL
jgi:hypothetical protein